MKTEYKTTYQNLLRPLTTAEFGALKESIKEIGLMYPIVVNEDNVILDGHHRYRVCSELNIPIHTITKNFPNKTKEKKFVIDSNLMRRHMNDFEKAQAMMVLLKDEQVEARERQAKGTCVSNDTKGRATEKVASLCGLSTTIFERARKILESGDEILIGKCQQGKISISSAYNQLVVKQRKLKTPPLPSGEFDVIYADPPWRYDFSPSQGAAEHKYPTMPTEDICSLKIPSCKNAVLFLWVTLSKIPDGVKVLTSWGFEFKSSLCWVKEKDGKLQQGLGYYVIGAHEIILIGKKGSFPSPLAEDRPVSVVKAQRTTHSEKPAIFYDIIENMFPNRKYLELFARKKHSEKWTAWGNELTNEKRQAKKIVSLDAFPKQ